MRLLLIALLFALELMALSKQQVKIKELVYKEARKYSRYPSTLVAICMTESSLGVNTYNREGSLGIMQMQVGTARDLANFNESVAEVLNGMTDAQIAVKLLTDHRFSVFIATKQFERLRKAYGYFGAISRYNGGAKNYSYYNKVETNKKGLR